MILAAIVVIGLIALSSSLTRQVEGPARADDTDRSGELADLETGGARVGRIAAPAVSGRSDNGSGRSGAAAQRQAPRQAIVENFDAALRRAEGEATLSGRVLGRANETDADRDSRRRQMRDMMTSAAVGADLRDLQQAYFNQRDRQYKPVAGAEVFLYEADPNTTHPPLRTAVADQEGSFTLANLNDADQRYILVVKSEGYAPEATYVSMNRESRSIDVHVEEGVPLRGRVIDSETSEPVVGATVYYPNPNWGTFAPLGVTTTTIGGEYVFPRVSTGRLLSQASADGYATRRVRLRAPDDSSTIELQPGGASISGVTIDRLTGKPQGGARVWAESGFRVSESTVSREDGTFEIGNLPEGNYEVYAVRGMRSESQNIALGRREKVKDVEITLPASVLVSGQVVHARDGKPLEGIKVWYESIKGSQHRRTDVEGRFAFETMAIDEYSIMIHEKGFLPVRIATESSGTEEIITRKIARNQSSDELTIRLRAVRTVEGKVTRPAGMGGGGGRGGWGGFGRDSSAERGRADGNGNVPARDVELTLTYMTNDGISRANTKSDAAGNFFFNLADGPRRADGYVVARQNFMMDGAHVRVPRNRPLELTLGPNVLRGQLYLSDESPLDGVPVTASVRVPRRQSDTGRVHDLTLGQTTTRGAGQLFMSLPANETVQMSFSMPDGRVINKDFRTSELLRGSALFVYDPVSADVMVDVSQGRGRGAGRRGMGGRGPGGRGGEGGPRRGAGEGGQPSQQEGGATNLTGAPTASGAQ